MPQTQTRTAEFLADLRTKLVDALDVYGAEIVAETKQSLSTPYPPHSGPNTAPHLITGQLMEGIVKQVDPSASGVTLTIASSRAGGDPNVPIYLEFGHNLRGKGATAPAGPAQAFKGLIAAHAAQTGSAATLSSFLQGSGGSERPYMRPEMDRIATTGLRRLAGLLGS